MKITNTTKILVSLFFTIVVLCAIYEILHYKFLYDELEEDGKLYGIEYYWWNHNIKSKTPLQNGKKSGWMGEFYQDGVLKNSSFWREGKRYSHGYSYYHELDTFLSVEKKDTFLVIKPLIKSYDYINHLYQRNLIIDFNRLGEVSYSFGKTVPEYFVNKEVFIPGDTIHMRFRLPADIPCDYEFISGYYDFQQRIHDTAHLKVDSDRGIVDYYLVCDSSRILNVCFINRLTFSNLILSDTLFFEIVIKEPN